MAPGTAAGGAPLSIRRAARITLGRIAIIIVIIIIPAPLVHVLAHIVHAEIVRLVDAHLGRAAGLRIATYDLFFDGGSLPQGKSASFSAPRRALPLGLGGQSKQPFGFFAQPPTICRRVVPTDADHRLVSLEKIGSCQNRQYSLCLFEKIVVLSIRDRKSGDTEASEPHSMAGPFVSCSRSLPIKNEPS